MDVRGGHIESDAGIFVENLVQIARRCNNPSDARNFVSLIANIPVKIGIKRHAKTNDDKAKEAKKKRTDATNNLWQCDRCKKKISNKANLQRHLQTVHKNEFTAPLNRPTATKKGAHAKTPDSRDVINSRKSSDTEYPCALCKLVLKSRKVNQHYGIDHFIDYPDEILFNNGNVLVISDRDTDNGNAVWFKSEREKAKQRYKDATCRFCENVELDDKDLLEHHYKTFHKVDHVCMEAIQHLFRADKKAHMVTDDVKKCTIKKRVSETIREIPVNKRKRNSTAINKPDVKADRNAQKSQHAQSAGLIMYVCKCGVASEICDSAVEHSQRHLALDYTPITETCGKCKFTFEASCFADHSSHHEDGDISHDDFKVVAYDYAKLLSSDWLDMFKDLAQHHRDEASSNIYKYTRSVKLNPKSNTGVPIYQCDMCQLCIDPAKVENHSRNYDTCVKNKRSSYSCSECGYRFVSDKVLKKHKEDHKIGPTRLVTFNSKDDVYFNKTLQKVQYNQFDQCAIEDELLGTNEHEEIVEKSRKPVIQLISDTQVTRVCKQCNENVFCTVYDAHIADHEHKKKLKMIQIARELNDMPSTQNLAGIDDHQSKSAAEKDAEGEEQVLQNDGNNINRDIRHDEDGGGHIEAWGSDSDSCPSLKRAVIVAEAEIHANVKNHENDLPQGNNKPAGNADINMAHVGNQQSIEAGYHTAETPETLLGNICGASESQTKLSDTNEERQSTQDLLLVLECNRSSQDTAANINENQTTHRDSNNELSQDMFIDDIQTPDSTNNDAVTKPNLYNQHEHHAVSQEMFTNDNKENQESESIRLHSSEASGVVEDRGLSLSSRDLLHIMLPGDDSFDLAQSLEEERRKKREFEELNALIAKRLSSREGIE